MAIEQPEPKAEIEKTIEGPLICVPKYQIFQYGEHEGAFITVLGNESPRILFSDNILLSNEDIEIHGLLVGLKGNKAYSKEVVFKRHNDWGEIAYSFRIDPNLVKEFDQARFSGSFPNIVRFLHTATLYHADLNSPVNHLEFVIGEIINRPIAIGKRLLVVADRVVIDDQLIPIFYDCMLFKVEEKDGNFDISMTYEPFITVELTEIQSIILLGRENF